MFAEAAHRHQTEVAALKLVQARPRKPLRNPINRLRSKYVVVVSIVVEVKMLLRVHCQVVGGDIQQAYRGRRALPFQRVLAEGSFGAFRL